MQIIFSLPAASASLLASLTRGMSRCTRYGNVLEKCNVYSLQAHKIPPFYPPYYCSTTLYLVFLIHVALTSLIQVILPLARMCLWVEHESHSASVPPGRSPADANVKVLAVLERHTCVIVVFVACSNTYCPHSPFGSGYLGCSCGDPLTTGQLNWKISSELQPSLWT